jgi:hypothetical protein
MEISLFIDTRIKRESLPPVKTPPYFKRLENSPFDREKSGNTLGKSV